MSRVKTCSICGEIFVAVTEKQKFCSQKCYGQCKAVFQVEQERNSKIKDTLCWDCKKATGDSDCPWANDFESVDGWDATPTYVKTMGRIEQSYIVNDCPLFERDKR